MTLPSRFVVGYDGSTGADAALRWAGAVAAQLDARVRVVHAVGLLEHGGFTPAGAHELRARSIAERAGVGASRFEWLVGDGAPAAVLRRAADGTPGADLLVVGTRGAGAHPGALLGSTSLELAQDAPGPVVVVPEDPPG